MSGQHSNLPPEQMTARYVNPVSLSDVTVCPSCTAVMPIHHKGDHHVCAVLPSPDDDAAVLALALAMYDSTDGPKGHFRNLSDYGRAVWLDMARATLRHLRGET